LEVTGVEAKLREIIDHHEIRKTLGEYCQGCDRADPVRMASVYAEDSWDDHGELKASGPEFSRVMAARIRETYDTMYHLLGQSTIRVDGDSAAAETYFIAIAQTKAADGPSICNQLGGRFIDKLERTGDGWKIKHRTVVGDWNIALPLGQDWPRTRYLARGQHSNADLVYAALGRVHGSLTESVRIAEIESPTATPATPAKGISTTDE
jgi:ketosteroid isomerase-like protein